MSDYSETKVIQKFCFYFFPDVKYLRSKKLTLKRASDTKNTNTVRIIMINVKYSIKIQYFKLIMLQKYACME